MSTPLDQAEKNLMEVCGLVSAHPGALLSFKKEIEKQSFRALKKIKFGRLILDIVVSETGNGEPLQTGYLLRRASSHPLDDAETDTIPYVLDCVRSGAKMATSEREAIYRIQERLVENLSLLAPTDRDTLNIIRDQAKRATAILSTEPIKDAKVITPFRALIVPGGTVENESLPRRPSGVMVFDQECLRGGFVTGSSVLVAGIINTGKSYLTQHFLKEEAFLGGTPMVCSMEDNQALTQLRWTSYLLGISTEKVEKMSDDELTAALLKKYQSEPHKLQAIARIKMWCPDSPPTAQEICAKIDEVEKEEHVIVTRFSADYIQNINDTDQRGDTRAERLFHAANIIYQFASDRKKNAIIVSQAKGKEDSNDKFLGMSEALAESFLVGRNAHYLVTMKVTKQEEERRLLERDKRSRINLAFKKNKFGPKDAFFAIFNGEKGQWHFFKNEHEREQAWNTL